VNRFSSRTNYLIEVGSLNFLFILIVHILWETG
jgi:hypothetical protein